MPGQFFLFYFESKNTKARDKKCSILFQTSRTRLEQFNCFYINGSSNVLKQDSKTDNFLLVTFSKRQTFFSVSGITSSSPMGTGTSMSDLTEEEAHQDDLSTSEAVTYRPR